MSKRVLIKWVIVPSALLLLYFVIVMQLRSIGYIIEAFFGIFAGVFYSAVIFGWLWLLPLVPLSAAAAYSKSRWLYKFVPLSIPALSAAYVMSRYDPGYLRSDTVQLLTLFVSVPLILLFAYVFFFYAIALDEVTSCVRSKCKGTKRASFGKCAAGWALSALAAIAVAVAVPTVKYNIMADTEHADAAYSEAAERLHDAEIELLGSISEKYGRDIAKIGEFACRYGVSDWEYCQDEKLEDSWRRVFREGNCQSDISIADGKASFFFFDEPVEYDSVSGMVTFGSGTADAEITEEAV